MTLSVSLSRVMSEVGIPIVRPYFDAAILEAVKETLASGYWTRGPKVDALESALADCLGLDHVVAVNSGTAAIMVMLQASGLQPGDKVLLPAFGFVASANAVRLLGGEVVFCEIDLSTYNLTAEILEVSLRKNLDLRFVMAVHAFGRMENTEAFANLCKEFDVSFVEDAACALGALAPEAPGHHSLAAAFSLHPRKPVTCGEGGFIACKDAGLAARARVIRHHGVERDGNVSVPGYNFRLSDILAALALAQLNHLADWLEQRQQLAECYEQALLENDKLITPLTTPIRAGHRHAWQSYVLQVKGDQVDQVLADRKRIIGHLNSKSIEALPGYSYIPEMYGQNDNFPAARIAGAGSLAVPFFPGLSEQDLSRITDALKEATNE